MFLVLEMNWTGQVHAPCNSATTQVVARAFPNQRVRLIAERDHIDELKKDPCLARFLTLNFGLFPLTTGYEAARTLFPFVGWLVNFAS